MRDFFETPIRASAYRHKASELCKKFMSKLVVIMLIYMAITVAASFVDSLFSVTSEIQDPTADTITIKYTVGIVSFLLSAPLSFSLILVAQKVYQDIAPEAGDVFAGFRLFGRAFVVSCLSGLYIALWSLLIIPAFIKPFSYAMAPYIAIDNPELSANQCITESRKMMNGYKWKLFCLHFSYIGWYFLCGLTLGILALWVTPKVRQAEYLFYLKVSGKGIEMEEMKKADQSEFEVVFETEN